MPQTPEERWEAGKSLLAHVTDEDCTDPDCEICCIWVGVQEETVYPSDQAFWLAGFVLGWNAAIRQAQNATDEMMALGLQEGIAILSQK